MKIEKITWPTSDKVMNQFLITLGGIILLVVFFLIVDYVIANLILTKIY